MYLAEDHEILESVFVEMDPAIFGFAGVFLDLWRRGEEYVLTETAAGTGNRLLLFSTRKRELAYGLWREELEAHTPYQVSLATDFAP